MLTYNFKIKMNKKLKFLFSLFQNLSRVDLDEIFYDWKIISIQSWQFRWSYSKRCSK